MSDEMIRCPQCGHENKAGDHFCSNCGTRLLRPKPAPDPEPAAVDPYAAPDANAEPVFASDIPQASSTASPSGSASSGGYGFPPPAQPSFLGGSGQPPSGTIGTQSGAGDDDANWRMSSLGPPPKPKRRLWLWIVLGILGFCILVCIGLAIFFNTGTGQHWLSDLGTTVAVEATKQANATPTP
ncbi:MAG: zinc ribbon domain-containing protein [Thermomicrobiales bacterium]